MSLLVLIVSRVLWFSFMHRNTGDAIAVFNLSFIFISY